ncbi:MAG: lysophospholipase [Nitrospirota bacterium]|nr:lysophospholipase [Nitrospirota bacterium]
MTPPERTAPVPPDRSPVTATETDFRFTRDDGMVLRGRYLPGDGALIAFLSGFRSVHYGTKARAVADWAAEHGHACLRFDHMGHGDSDGVFEDFRISQGMGDIATCIGQVVKPGQDLIVVGSSMGGWMALEATRNGLIAPRALLLIAPPVDFFSRRMATMHREMAEQFKREGFVELDDQYQPGVTYRLTQGFMMDAMMMEPPRGALQIPCPVTIIHGTEDEAVPADTGRRLAAQIGGHCRLVEIDGGDHRLSGHLDVILGELAALTG